MDQTRHKIVLVDDNIATLNQGKSLLQAFYKVYTAASAATLFENLEHGIPDLILLDVEMPEMDGFQVIEKLKADDRYKDIPVIFLTSKSDEESERKGFSLGAVDYITKPFSGPLLQKRISNQILYMRVAEAVKNYANNFDVMVDEITKANQRMKILLDKTPLCARLWDVNHKMIDCNEAAVKLFGFKDKQECLMRYSELYPEFQPDGQRSIDKVAICIEKAFEEGSLTFEWTYRMLDGSLMPSEVTLIKVEYDDSYAVAGYTRDLREQIAAIEEMRRAEIAEERNKAKSRFLANMSHEIRTPMNSIMGFAELALNINESPRVKDYLERIADSTKWLLRVINDILDISKIESGNMSFENAPFDLRDVIMRCQSVIMPSTKEKGLKLHVYSEPVYGKKLMGDSLRLYQALMNLLSNSVKFTETGTIELRSHIVSLGEAQPGDPSPTQSGKGDRAKIYFEVKDSGIGMSPDQIDRVFESFVQADSSTTRTYGGTGLGLAITKSIVELMGGSLKTECSLGGGCKFSFELVFDTIDSSDVMVDVIDFKTIARPYFSGLILVCDDNLMNQEVICEHLANVGLRTVVAENGKEGVDMVKRRIHKNEAPFDLIFMDVYMPIMDGIEAASEIIKLDTGTPILAMTANVMAGEIENYKRHGMSDCLSKPFTSQDLWHILLKYLTPQDPPSSEAASQAEERLIESLGENEREKRLHASFVKSNQTRFAEIADAISKGDIKLAHRLAHTLKGNAGLIGKGKLCEAASNVEALLKKGELPDHRQHMRVLQAELISVLNELSPLIEESDGDAVHKPLDTEQVMSILERLEPMLKNRNPECTNLLSDIRTIPGGPQLARQIEEYDFKSALATLSRLKKEL